MTDKPNYATFERDSETGLEFIVQVGTGARLYKMPPCEICGIAHYSLINALKTQCGCVSCEPAHRERNDNEAAWA